MRNQVPPVITIISAFFLLSFLPDNKRTDRIEDGPYIFMKDKTVAKWVENGYFRQKNIDHGNFGEFKDKFNLNFDYRDLLRNYSSGPDHRHHVRKIDSICAISDIHGEFDKYAALLKSQGVVDESLSWNFGKGHLVVLGDYFDRGDKVTEILWHLFGLEKQAEKAGGRVHVMLGNHEMMIFDEDVRYINNKYRSVEKITGISYPGLFSDATVLGNWLRRKPVIVSADDIIFVHAGLSTKIINKKLPIEEINKLFFQMLVAREVESEADMNNLALLTEEYGPIWYRGFFEDADFNEASIDSVLSFYKKKHIIVGHTTAEEFQYLFNGKIIGIDAGIGSNNDGAVLIIKNGDFYKGTLSGERIRL
jgi:hypothetical protein